jgi:hypothetical protein
MKRIQNLPGGTVQTLAISPQENSTKKMIQISATKMTFPPPAPRSLPPCFQNDGIFFYLEVSNYLGVVFSKHLMKPNGYQ